MSSGSRRDDAHRFQAHGPEQVVLDHERVKAADALLRVDPVQNGMVLYWRTELVRHQNSFVGTVPAWWRDSAGTSPRRADQPHPCSPQRHRWACHTWGNSSLLAVQRLRGASQAFPSCLLMSRVCPQAWWIVWMGIWYPNS